MVPEPPAIIPDAHHPRVWGRKMVMPTEIDRQHPHRSQRRWGPGAKTLMKLEMGKPRSHRPSHMTHRRPPISHGPRVTCCGLKHCPHPHMTHLPRVLPDHAWGDQALPSGKHTQPSTDVPIGSTLRLQLQVLRGQDFTLRRDSGAEGEGRTSGRGSGRALS